MATYFLSFFDKALCRQSPLAFADATCKIALVAKVPEQNQSEVQATTKINREFTI
jgi:hypothetical protein